MPPSFTHRFRAAPRAAFLLAAGLTAAETTPPVGLDATAAPDPVIAPAMRLLQLECLSCHNRAKHKGGLVLESRELALRGGDNGPVLIPGQPNESQLHRVLLPTADPHMPPKKQLPAEAIDLIEAWILADAPYDPSLLREAGEDARATSDNLRPLPPNHTPAYALALSSDGSWLAAGYGTELRVFNTTNQSAAPARQWTAHDSAVQSVAWRPGERQAEVATGAYRDLALWDTSGERLRHFTNGLGRFTALAFSPDGLTLVAADSDPSQGGSLHFLDLNSEPAPPVVIPAHADAIYDLAISGDGQWLATAGGDLSVKLWDLPQRAEIRRLEGHQGQILGVAFNDDASLLATASSDREIKIWERDSGRQRLTVNRLDAPLSDLVWLAGQPRLLAAAQDGSLRLIHAERDRPERALESVREVLHALAAAPDGSTAYAAGASGAIFAWDRPVNRTQWRRWPVDAQESP